MYDKNPTPKPPDNTQPADPWAAADLSYQADRERRERRDMQSAIRRQNAYNRRVGAA